jgi:SpoIVB peptidase S55
MHRLSFGSLRRSFSLVAVTALLLIGTTLTAGPATAVGTCTPADMPDVLPTADMQPGMTGTAWTVVQGTTPVSFDVEILAVEHDVILPGHDFVLVYLSGPVIDATNGIAAGMSGSPVYINGQLAGALAYGVGDAHLAGMTPAEEMVKIFNNPTSVPAQAFPQKVSLSPALRRAAADAEGVAVAAAPTTASTIPTPLAMSGVSSRAMGRVNKMVKRLHMNVVPYSSHAANTSQPLSQTPLEPGDSYSAVISTGDLTFGGIGTETATCGNLSLAFGHPFDFSGRTSLGLHGANVAAVVVDPLFGSYKWADITEPHGTVDQDRFSGIRGIDGTYPDAIPITSNVTNPDLSTSRSGETDLLLPELAPDLALFHLLYNIDSTFDRIGDGTTKLSWSVDGTLGPNGTGAPWSFTRSNMFYSDFDTSFSSVFEMYDMLYQIENNPYAKVTITDIHQSANVTQTKLTEQIKKVQWKTNQHPTFTSHRVIQTKPNGLIRFRVTVLPAGSSTPEVVEFTTRVPDTIRGNGRLEVRGGGQSGFFFFGAPGKVDGSASTTGAMSAASSSESFEGLLAQLHNQDRGFDLITQIFAPGVDSGSRPGRVARPQSNVVFGEHGFALSIDGGTVIDGCGKPCPVP